MDRPARVVARKESHMTDRYEIARMALKSGFAYEAATGHIVATSGYTEVICTAGLERFAALVAAAEREACAKLAASKASVGDASNYPTYIAAAIRARGNK